MTKQGILRADNFGKERCQRGSRFSRGFGHAIAQTRVLSASNAAWRKRGFIAGTGDLTQEELAEKAGVSARYIQSVEAGEYFPSLPTLVRLRAVLRCDWEELFAGCDKV